MGEPATWAEEAFGEAVLGDVGRTAIALKNVLGK